MRRILLVALLLATPASNAPAAVELIAEIGQPAVGFPEGWIYWNVENPAIGRGGHVFFGGAADVSVGSTANFTPALWAGRPHELAAIIRRNDPIEGLPPNVVFSEAPQPKAIVTRSGHVGFLARLAGAVIGNLSDTAVLAHVDGVNRLVLRVGAQAPGFDPGVLVSSGNVQFAFTDAGMVLSGLTSSGQQALWFWDFETVTLLGASGEEIIPGLPGCTLVLFSSLAMNEAGTVVFPTTLLGDGCPLAAIVSIPASGDPETVLELGAPVPGMAGTTFDGFGLVYPVRIDDAGDVAFPTLLRRDAANPTARSAWLARANGALELLALEGESLPGQPNELLSGALGLLVHSVADGHSALLATTTTITQALLVGEPRPSQPYPTFESAGESQLGLLAQEDGAPPPGFPATWFFDTLEGPLIGGEGLVAFRAIVADALDVNGTRTAGIWRGRSAADLTLAASEGMPIQVDGEESTLTLILGLAESSTQTGLPSQLDDRGQIVFQGARAGTSANAIFLVPEPGASGTLVAVAALGALRVRRGSMARRELALPYHRP